MCAFLNKGTDWGIPVQFGDDLTKMMWKTEEPPACYWDCAPDVWTRLLQQRGWLDEWGWLKIPTWLTKPRHNYFWRELQMELDAHPWDPNSGTYSPITRLAEQVVVWHPDDLFLVQGHDTRSARDMRDRLSRYKRRCFSKPWEAGYSKIDSKIKATIRQSSIWYCTLFVHASHSHAFLEADVGWYQPVRPRQDDETVPADALAHVQPFHPGVLNILYPYEATLAKQRALKQRLQRKPSYGRYQSQVQLAAAASSAVPIVCGAWNLIIPLHGVSNLT